MKEEYKWPWIEALNSGKYEQGVEMLKHAPSGEIPAYCCLGVLAEISDGCEFVPEGLKYTSESEYDNYTHHNGTHAITENEEFTTGLLEKFGISSKEQSTLIKMNDTEHKTFEEIAAYIKENL